MEGRPRRTVVHDLNNELAVISASAELAAASEPDADVRAHIERIGRAARAASELVRELREEPTAASEPLGDTPALPERSNAKILVVDDSETMRQLIAYALEPGGFDVSVAVDGEDALSQIGGAEGPDLLLTDVQMPSMSGPQLAARARHIRPELPVLFVTGDADEAIEFDGGTAPALRKPFVASDLIHAVRAALGR